MLAKRYNLLFACLPSLIIMASAQIAFAGGGYVQHSITYTSGYGHSNVTIDGESNSNGQQQTAANADATSFTGQVQVTESPEQSGDTTSPQQRIRFANVSVHQSQSQEFGAETFGGQTQADGTARATVGFFETQHRTSAQNRPSGKRRR